MIDMAVSNYRGSLHIDERDGKFWWAVQCDMEGPEEWEWEEIPKSLYDALAKFHRDRVNEDG